MHSEAVLSKIKKSWHGSLKSYLIGLICSLVLTSIAFFTGADRNTLMALALLQAVLQLIFFLHIGQEAKPRYFTIALYFTVLILLIIVIGSLWIMYDLNSRMMPHMEM